MKNIATITDEDLNITSDDIGINQTRHAVRLVLEDVNGNIALIYSDKHGHHKLPGGGIEEGEDFEVAAMREAKEEVGCDIDFKNELGFSIIELRKQFQQKQISTLFRASVKGNIGCQQLTEKEIKDGFHSAIWVSLDDAIKLLEQDTPITYIGKFMHARDLIFLKETRKFLNK